jgi:two-component system sensor histidine kinase CiaH
LVKKFDLKNDEKFVIFKKLKYDLEEYLEDIFKFFIISFLFSIFIYFISRRFIDNIFVPMEQNIDDMKNFIHNAGHELKTPISVIDSNLQILADTKKFDKSMNKEMRDEVNKLNSLIDCLVNLSDVDSFKKADENNLKDILEEIVKEFKSKIKVKKLKVKLDIKYDVIIKANRSYLYMFLSNLI